MKRRSIDYSSLQRYLYGNTIELTPKKSATTNMQNHQCLVILVLYCPNVLMENNSRPNDALGHLSIERNWIAIQQLFKFGECTAPPDIITVMVHPILLRLLSTNSDLYAMTLGLFQTIRTNCIWVWASQKYLSSVNYELRRWYTK